MSGRHDRSKEGQLALMDALVFLALAMVICSVQLSQFQSEVRANGDTFKEDCRCDPSALLHALLGTSIGRTLTLDTVPEVTVRSETRVADCLAMEALCLREGGAAHSFVEMNAIVIAIAINATAPSTRPCLTLDVFNADSQSCLLSMGQCEGTCGDCYAASCELITHGTSVITVTLVLLPALLPEALGI